MSKSSKSYQECCLYFTANSLSRHITELADEEFRLTGLSPSYAYLLLVVMDEPGLTQSEISKKMNLKSSTLTRFFDKLVQKGLVDRIQNGREINIYATEKGAKTKVLIYSALDNLHQRYFKIFGKEFTEKLTANIKEASKLIENN